MKAKLSGKIDSIERVERGEALVSILLDGKLAPTAPVMKFDIKFRLSQRVADELRFGQVFYLTISDEEP